MVCFAVFHVAFFASKRNTGVEDEKRRTINFLSTHTLCRER